MSAIWAGRKFYTSFIQDTMKSVHAPPSCKENEATKTIERCSKGAPLEAIRDNIAASSPTNTKRNGFGVKEYLKNATETGKNVQEIATDKFIMHF